MKSMLFNYIGVFGILILAVAVSGCDRHADDDHDELAMVEILDRTQAPPTVIATWTRNGGWDRETLMTLDSSAGVDENYGRASIGVRMYDGDGDVIPMSTVSTDPDGNRVCSEFFVRYGVALQATENIIHHPQGSQGTITIDGEQRNTYHCDHLHVYPRQPGTTQIQFFLFHIDHADDATTPIQVVVE